MTANPYEPPGAFPDHPLARRPVKWLAAIGVVVASVCFVVFYMSFQLPRTPRSRPIPVSPTIVVPFALSIVSAVWTRNLALAPLACFLGMTSGSLMFAAFRGWAGAATHTVVPIAMALSVPSIFVVILRRSKTNTAR